MLTLGAPLVLGPGPAQVNRYNAAIIVLLLVFYVYPVHPHSTLTPPHLTPILCECSPQVLVWHLSFFCEKLTCDVGSNINLCRSKYTKSIISMYLYDYIYKGLYTHRTICRAIYLESIVYHALYMPVYRITRLLLSWPLSSIALHIEKTCLLP